MGTNYMDNYQLVMAAAQKAKDTLDRVENEIKPYIGENGNWWVGTTDTGQLASIQGEDGAPGPVGPVGPVGTTGPQGEQGAQGERGWQGIPGVQGDEGPRGWQGIPGPEGPPGPQGAQGPKGEQGIQGIRGPQGNTGPIGATGATGAEGPQGIPGPVGETGPMGPAGPQGVQGATGLQGEKGDKGDKGDQGAQGPIGNTGAQGPVGATGATGPKGDTGPAGPKGDTGPAGPQGIQGPKGDTGDTGPVGPQGIQGPKGDTGAQGERGWQGVQGTKGDTGPAGPTGPQGPVGEVSAAELNAGLANKLDNYGTPTFSGTGILTPNLIKPASTNLQGLSSRRHNLEDIMYVAKNLDISGLGTWQKVFGTGIWAGAPATLTGAHGTAANMTGGEVLYRMQLSWSTAYRMIRFFADFKGGYTNPDGSKSQCGFKITQASSAIHLLANSSGQWLDNTGTPNAANGFDVPRWKAEAPTYVLDRGFTWICESLHAPGTGGNGWTPKTLTYATDQVPNGLENLPCPASSWDEIVYVAAGKDYDNSIYMDVVPWAGGTKNYKTLRTPYDGGFLRTWVSVYLWRKDPPTEIAATPSIVGYPGKQLGLFLD